MKTILWRYLFEIVLVGLVIIFVVLYYSGKTPHETDDYKRANDSLNKVVDSLKLTQDSLVIIENKTIRNISITNNYYDSLEKIIVSGSDSFQFTLLRSNIDKFGGQNSQ